MRGAFLLESRLHRAVVTCTRRVQRSVCPEGDVARLCARSSGKIGTMPTTQDAVRLVRVVATL